MTKPAPEISPDQGFLLYPWQRTAWEHLWRAHQKNRLHHALLVTGAPGMGKLQLARNLAQALLCRFPGVDGVPCGNCPACHWFKIGHHPDYHLIGPDADGKSDEIKVDVVREMIASQGLSAHQGHYKLLVLNPADRMNRGAANSLLKTLEEPVASTLIILLSHRPGALLPTIRSRCQSLYLAPPPEEDALAWLRTQPGCGDQPHVSLRLAGGAPLAALRLARPEMLAQRQDAWNQFLALSKGQGQLMRTAEVWSQWDLSLILNWLGGWVADLARLACGHPNPWLANPDVRAELAQLARCLDPAALHRFWRELVAAGDQVHANLIPQLLLESLLLRWTQIASGR